MYWKITSMCLYILVHINIILNNYFKEVHKHTAMQIRQCFECLWGMSVHANEEMLAGYANPDAGYPDVDHDAT